MQKKTVLSRREFTAASALARQYPDDGPHLIYLPERPVQLRQIIQDVKRVTGKLGRCVIAISEGVADLGITGSDLVAAHAVKREVSNEVRDPHPIRSRQGIDCGVFVAGGE